MGRFSVTIIVAHLGLPFVAASGCAGELTDAQREAPDGGGAGAAGGAGGAAGASGAGGASGSTGTSPEACVLALTKAKICATVGCHGGSSPAAQLLLSDDVIHQPQASLVDKANKGMSPGCMPGMYKLIDSARPELSLLYTKLGAHPPCGERMPSGGSVTDAEMSCVLNWIKSVGATP